MPDVCVVHLVWGPLGTEPLRRFVASYREQPAGTDHRLLVLLNGVTGPEGLATCRRELAGVEHDELELPSRMLDLPAYRFAAERVSEPIVCFLNSYSEIRGRDWLAKLATRLSDPGVGLVGASGSYESAYSAAPITHRWLFRRWFPPFPNPHIRTNAFMLRRELALSLDWGQVRGKYGALRLENGKRSLTRQVLDRQSRVLVVGRNGKGYEPRHWPGSGTFRSGDQSNLLVTDNRTRQYEEADPATRRYLCELAWGRPYQRRDIS